MLFPDARILLFAKAPDPGQVKTRLIPAVGADYAAQLYAQLLTRTVSRISRAQIAALECCCAPDSGHPFFQTLATDFNLTLSDQQGRDLGERMAHSVRQRIDGATPLILIGGDCPVLRPGHLQQAIEWLSGSSDAVLAPAEDGGYVMLGLRQFDASLFRDIAWGGEYVLDITRQRLSALGWQWRESEVLWDLDRPEDLQRLERAGISTLPC